MMGFAKGTYHHSPETRQKIKEHNPRYWLGKGKSGMSGHRQSEEMKAKLKQRFKGRKISPEWLEKNRLSHIGIIPSQATRLRMSEAGRRRYGTTEPTDRHWRNRIEYKLWRMAVFQRDGYTCRMCGSQTQLEADHIKPWAKHPELRFDIDNGRTLCRPCHLKYGWRGSHLK